MGSGHLNRNAGLKIRQRVKSEGVFGAEHLGCLIPVRA